MLENTLQENTIPSVGQILKSARLSRSLTLEEIAKKLRINKRHLSHLEEDQKDLVCDVYTLGFLKSYAQYLNLDEKDLIKRFKKVTLHPSTSSPPFPTPLPHKKLPHFRIFSFSLFAFIALCLGWEWFGYFNLPKYISKKEKRKEDQSIFNTKVRAPNLVPLREEHLQTSAPTEMGPSLTEHPSILPPSSVLLKVTEEAWIEVKDQKENVILKRLFQPGENYEFENPHDLILKTGNAKGTVLIYGNKILSFPENAGTIRSNISLDPEKWVEQLPETH